MNTEPKATPDVERDALSIAADFCERFQKNYPAEPLHEMMGDLAKSIQELAGASRPVKRLTDEDVDTVIQDTLGSEVKIYNEEMRDVVATIARAVRDACEGRKG